ncbi:potassium channel subfamily K member 15 isoform X2 [Cydia pomonella]|uniref:potassium channel subfamily K member 15 isoform X2 n=1 Tax=Cydia pomonella TaxID=82600 RepID=UPI002ADE67E9|nr:potassium channel subfamily K member 15 isoform X2 [Cydia pomonella]
MDEVPKYPPPPPPPASKRLSRPKITLQIPQSPHGGPPSAVSRFSTPNKYHGYPPRTPESHKFHPNFNPEWYSHMTQASDFIRNTAKSGLSFGEKTALWIVSKLKHLSKRWFTHFFLMLCLVLYSVMGAAIFMALEAPHEEKYDKQLSDIRKDFAKTIHDFVVKNTALKDENYTFIVSKLEVYEKDVSECITKLPDNNTTRTTWTFVNSMFYSGTIFTTIGYGHITPKTLSGRIATIVYAIVGIPLFLIVLADFGKLFTRIIKFLWSFIRRFYYTRSCRSVRRVTHVEDMVKGLNMVADVVRRPSQIFNTEDLESKLEGNGDPPKIERKPSDVPPPLPPKPGQLHTTVIEDSIEPETPAPSDFIIDEEFNLPISIAIFILVLYIVIGALGYDIWEKWGFFESFYFVFISMTTIGLGDYVPKHPLFMMMSILYLVFGLALMSMCINVVQVKLSDTFKTASRKIADTVGLPIAEEESLTEGNPVPPIEIAPVHKSKNKTDEDKSNEGKENENKDKFVQINCD